MYEWQKDEYGMTSTAHQTSIIWKEWENHLCCGLGFQVEQWDKTDFMEIRASDIVDRDQLFWLLFIIGYSFPRMLSTVLWQNTMHVVATAIF